MMEMQAMQPYVPVRVELTSGIVTDATIHNWAGVRTLPAEISKHRFFIALVEADGGDLIIWDGAEYGAAIAEAEEIRTEWGISEPVHDLVVGGQA
jgi:hypothetical protein